MFIETLYDICIKRVALLLNECYWPVGIYEGDEDHNPFSVLPCHINTELLSTVIELTPAGVLSVKDLYPILSSGRIDHFKLEDVIISVEEFVRIISVLSVCGMKLISLTLNKIFSPGPRGYLIMEDSCSSKSRAIECLIDMAPNLELIESDIQFDLSVIQNVHCLKHLKLNFVPKSNLSDIIPTFQNSVYIPNDTLTHLSVFEDGRHEIPVKEMAFLLSHCRELRSVGNSIARALNYLHGEELFLGTLEKHYKLQKYILGDAILNPGDATANVSIIHIATVTCPLTKELDVLVNDHQAVAALRDFKHLESFLIQWEHIQTGDFRLALQSVLECIGSQLKSLFILNFGHIDYVKIGTCCPDLNLLRVDYDNASNNDNMPQSLFKNLTTLHLDCQNGSGISASTLVTVLSNCMELSSLHLCNVPRLTDDVLATFLNRNKLAELNQASLIDCCLSEVGLCNLIQSCTSLKFLNFSSSDLTFNDAIAIVHEINPFVIMNAPSD